MADGYQVHAQALVDAANGVAALMAELDKHDVEDIDCDRAAVGHDALAGTLSDFCDRWDRGVNYLADDGNQLAARLHETANTYLGVEEKAGNAFIDFLSGMQETLKGWAWTR